MKKATKLVLTLFMAISLLGCGGEPENFEAEVKLPLSVKKGDEFIIVAKVNNTAAKQQKLVAIDIADTYLEGIAILRTEPNHKEAVHIPIADTMSYTFDLPVGAGEQKLVKFYAKAVKQGDYNSQIDFCVNSEFNFFSKFIRTIVE
ncbi:hypothetical protein N8843_08560 [Verrucomicrobia bacterium]|nr:hypothetical protein [Verrucomicrobiota bacterium]